MTSDALHPEPFPDLAAEASPSHPSPSDDPAPGPLLRALLAGAVALLVLLLPGQLAASRGDDGRTACQDGVCALGGRVALESSWQGKRADEIEIMRRDTC